MEIKFIINGKTFTTLCNTVKKSAIFRVELSDNYGNKAIAAVNNISHTITFISTNNTSCTISGKFTDYGKTEKGFKRNLVNFLIWKIRRAEEKFYLLDEENILSHLSKIVGEKASETSSSSDEIEKNYIKSAATLGFYSEKGTAIKGYADRVEVDLTPYAIGKIIYHINIYDLGYIAYGEKKWTFSSDEKNLITEMVHKLIELYDEGITPDKIWLGGKAFTPIEFIDFLYMRDLRSIIAREYSYEKGFFHIYHGYATKKLLIETNKSNVFNKWRDIAPISKSAFLEGLKWICGDTSSEEGPYTRAIALTPHGIVKLVAVHSESGYNYFDEKGKIFSGAYFTRKAITNKEKLFADENGEISTFCKIILSSKDRL